MSRTPWVEKSFDFDYPVEQYREFLQDLAATPELVAALVEGLPREVLVRRNGEAWSLQENVGHLMILERLFTRRLDDYDAGETELTPADMTNQATEAAGFNDAAIADLVEGFRAARRTYLERLVGKDPVYFGRVAFHARLGRPMRVVDQIRFQSEHDRHHLETMEALVSGS